MYIHIRLSTPLLLEVRWIFLLLVVTLFSSCSSVPILSLEVEAEFAHDSAAFTQGLVYDSEQKLFFESTGKYGESSIRVVEPETGQVLAQKDLSSQYFGEGLAMWNHTLYQLTWQSGVGFKWSADLDLCDLGQFRYSTQGWGLTLLAAEVPGPHDRDYLLMTDGSANVYFYNPEDMIEETSLRMQVHDGDTAVTRLNELEIIEGRLWANVWLTDKIAVINLTTSQVEVWIQMTELVNQVSSEHSGANVLNGLAYHDQEDRLWFTGKLWHKVFQVDLAIQHELIQARSDFTLQPTPSTVSPTSSLTAAPIPGLTSPPTSSPTVDVPPESISPTLGGSQTLGGSPTRVSTLAPSLSPSTSSLLCPPNSSQACQSNSFSGGTMLSSLQGESHRIFSWVILVYLHVGRVLYHW